MLGATASANGNHAHSVNFPAVMRRLFSVSLAVVLLAPWIAAANGAAVSVVPCPMHRSGEAVGRGQVGQVMGGMSHDKGSTESDHPHHGTTARGCNCAGECGRSGVAFNLPDSERLAAASYGIFEASFPREQSALTSVVSLLPFATGPPRRLRV
jgi:hypothetical protein